MRILITGASGYIGSELVPELLNFGHEIDAVDLSSGNSAIVKNNFPESYNFFLWDVLSTAKPPFDLSKYEAILPLAAVVGRIQAAEDPEYADRLNHLYIEDLVSKLSSDQVLIYPQTNMGLVNSNVDLSEEFDDGAELKPSSIYTLTKCKGEEIATEHPSGISIRLASVYGLSYAMKDHLLLNFLIKTAVTEGTIDLFQPNFSRSFIHLQDLAKIINTILINPNQAFGKKINIFDERLNLTKIEVLELLQKYVDFSINLIDGSDPDMRNYVIRSEFLSSIDFKCESEISHNILKIAEYYRNLPSV